MALRHGQKPKMFTSEAFPSIQINQEEVGPHPNPGQKREQGTNHSDPNPVLSRLWVGLFRITAFRDQGVDHYSRLRRNNQCRSPPRQMGIDSHPNKSSPNENKEED